VIGRKSALVETPGVEAVRGFSLRALALHVIDLRRDRRDDRFRDFILDREDIFQLTIVALGPEVVARFRVD
jgi:hypothetical protein